MKVFTKCPHCTSEYAEKTLCDTRAELAKEKGNSFQVNCNSCGKSFKVHVNDLRARKSGAAGLAAIIIFAISVPFAGYMIWTIGMGIFAYISITGVLLAPSVAFVLINKQEQVRVSSFNRLTVKR